MLIPATLLIIRDCDEKCNKKCSLPTMNDMEHKLQYIQTLINLLYLKTMLIFFFLEKHNG